MPSVACDGGRGFWRNVRRCGCLSRGGHRETSERCGGGRVCLAAGPEERKRRASGRLSCGLVGKGEEPRHCGVCVHPRSAKLPNHCTRCNGSGEQTSLFAHERTLRGPPGHDPFLLTRSWWFSTATVVQPQARERNETSPGQQRTEHTERDGRQTHARCAEAWTPRRTKMPSIEGHPFLGPFGAPMDKRPQG